MICYFWTQRINVNFMKMSLPLRVVVLFLILNYQQVFAQKEKLPVPFLPEIISQFTNVRDLTISPSEHEAYFTVQSPQSEVSTIVFIKKQNGKWTAPEVAPFSGKYNDMEPFLSHDGLKLYFVSNRPTDETSNEIKDFDIWVVGRKDVNSNWSKAINMGPPINSTGNDFYPSVAKSGNFYLTNDGPLSKGKDDIFVCKWNIDHYEAPVSLSDSINSEGYEFNAFVAPDETYIIYTAYNRKDGLGSGDLYISYSLGGGLWTSSKNLGDKINSAQMDYCPFANIKSNILYFTSKRSSLKADPATPRSIDELKMELNRYDNGFSRLYQVHFDHGK